MPNIHFAPLRTLRVFQSAVAFPRPAQRAPLEAVASHGPTPLLGLRARCRRPRQAANAPAGLPHASLRIVAAAQRAAHLAYRDVALAGGRAHGAARALLVVSRGRAVLDVAGVAGVREAPCRGDGGGGAGDGAALGGAGAARRAAPRQQPQLALLVAVGAGVGGGRVRADGEVAARRAARAVRFARLARLAGRRRRQVLVVRVAGSVVARGGLGFVQLHVPRRLAAARIGVDGRDLAERGALLDAIGRREGLAVGGEAARCDARGCRWL